MNHHDLGAVVDKPPIDRTSRPTIETVARAAGVSDTTVSHILNHPGKYRYAQKTVQRVREIARELRYSPNILAQSLAGQANPAIGVVCSSLTDANISRAVDRVIEIATGQHRHVVVATHPEKLPWAMLLDQGRVDWIIAIDQNLVESSNELLLPRSLERVIAVGPLPNYQSRRFGHFVHWDTTRNARLAMEHLASLGHKEVAILAGLYTTSEKAVPRIKAAYESAASLGITAHWISYPEETRENVARAGRMMTNEVLTRYPNITAIYCRQDYQAIGVFYELQKARKRIPEDVAVCGNFNLQDMLQFYPPLTSVDAPLVKGVEVAMELLAQADRSMPEGKGTDLTEHIRLVIRESTVG
jgi:LacI family transcriptional regulator